MPAFGVVLDACVLFPAALRDTLLRAADVGLYRLHWSDMILEEVRRNLVAQERTTELQAQRLITVMDEAFPDAAVRGFESLVEQMTNDPKDRHVLAAAVRAGAQVIVTANLRDFPQPALDPYEVEAQSPDEFLTNLLDLAPRRMLRLLHDQEADLRAPSMTVLEVLDEITVQAPEFAGLARQMLR